MTGKIRVAIVNEGAAGGLRRHVVQIPKMMNRDRFEITVIFSTRPEYGSEGDPAAELREAGIQSVMVQMSRQIAPAQDRQSLRRLKELLTPANFDVVHAHSAKAGYLARYSCRGTLPCIYSPHVFPFQRSGPISGAAYRLLERIAVPWTTLFVVNSETERKIALKLGAQDQQVAVVRNAALRPVLPADAGPAVRRDIGTATNTVVFLAVGRLAGYKGHGALLRAFAQLVRGTPAAELWIAGDGEERAAMQRLIQELRLTGRARLLGYRRDVPRLMAAADCVVLASRAEGSPNVILEALAAEKPIIATRVDGVTELLRDSDGWRLVPWNSIDQLSRAMMDFTRRPFPGVAIDSLPPEWFDFPAQVKKIEALYERCLRML